MSMEWSVGGVHTHDQLVTALEHAVHAITTKRLPQRRFMRLPIKLVCWYDGCLGGCRLEVF